MDTHQDFGDIAVDIISVVREGNVEGLKNWLSEYKLSDQESQEQKRIEIFGQSSWGCNMSGLIWAVQLDDRQIAKELSEVLLNAFPDLINVGDSEKSTPLHYTSLDGDAELIKFLFSKGAEILIDNNAENALHSATLNGHYEATKTLLKKGVDPNQRNVDGCTPLHNAVMNNQLKVVSLLTSHPKINLGIKNNAGQTALDLAQSKNNKEMVEMFELEKNDNLEEIFDLEDDISQLQDRINYLNGLCEAKKNETHQIYKKLSEIEVLHESAKKHEEQLLATETPKPSQFQILINETKSEIERADQLRKILENRQNPLNPTNTDSNQEVLENLYNNIIATVNLFDAIKLGLNDAKHPLNSLCKTIKSDHKDFQAKNSVIEMEIMEDTKIEENPKLAGFLIT